MRVIKLGDVVDVFSGQVMSRVIADPLKVTNDYITTISVRVIMPKAITAEGLINEADLIEEDIKVKDINNHSNKMDIESTSSVDKKYFTKVNDIVVKLSAPFDSATITKETQGCVVPSFCAIIRNRDLVNLDYLQAFLNSRLCKDQLKSKVSGSVNTILTIGKIKDIEIPIPDNVQQIEIGNRYRETQNKISILNEIVKLEVKRNDIQFINMVK